MTPTKIYLVYCPSCNDFYSIETELENAEAMRWKHYWKSEDGHVKEDNIEISQYERVDEK